MGHWDCSAPSGQMLAGDQICCSRTWCSRSRLACRLVTSAAELAFIISSRELWQLGLVVSSGPGTGSLSTMAASCSCLLAAPATASPTLTNASMEARGS